MVWEESAITSTKLSKPSLSLQTISEWFFLGVAEGSLYSVSALGEVAKGLALAKRA